MQNVNLTTMIMTINNLILIICNTNANLMLTMEELDQNMPLDLKTSFRKAAFGRINRRIIPSEDL